EGSVAPHRTVVPTEAFDRGDERERSVRRGRSAGLLVLHGGRPAVPSARRRCYAAPRRRVRMGRRARLFLLFGEGLTRASPVHGSLQRQHVATRLRGRVRSRRYVLRTRPGAERARPEGCVLRSAPCGLGDQHSTRGRRRSPRRGPRGGPCRTPLLSRGAATPRVEKGEARPGEGVGPDVQEVGGSWAAGEVAGVEVAAGEVVGAEAAVPVVARGAVPGHR